MVSVKRSELVSRVETAANLGFLISIPAVLLTAGILAEFRTLASVGQFGGSLGLLALAVGTFKRKRIAAIGLTIAFAAGSSLFVAEDLGRIIGEPHVPLVSLLVAGLLFLLVRGARAVHVLHAVKSHPIPRESRYTFRPTTETVTIR